MGSAIPLWVEESTQQPNVSEFVNLSLSCVESRKCGYLFLNSGLSPITVCLSFFLFFFLPHAIIDNRWIIVVYLHVISTSAYRQRKCWRRYQPAEVVETQL
ncbi:uncharacterized protein BDW43DRAFT_82301 [Aspergillus alliaceus]|uniref:uncharacterized protein n=1 Tax=Petromyces alliaceus TaxID=209559 RepID=UPI0012A5AC9A|nr:uncharacterized protein BDW43DRAFT_82301 [Aspergillus alliaceus]KAB8233606.1 hypothetical protein BDW43DRAFT_82301 [Aspergillus alliaceus]